MINAITLKDGTDLNCDMSNLTNRECILRSGSAGSSLLKAYTSGNFMKILDVNEIESVTIGNEVIKLEK